jgi:hypothetical protein
MTGSPRYHIAQLNIATFRAPVDSAEMAGFMALLAPLNALADAAPGFVWRLRSENSDDATDIRPYDDVTVGVNMSVWTSLSALRDYVYSTVHLDAVRQRREWFHRMAEPHLVLWWLPAGSLPTVDEAMARLEHLRAQGPGPRAFTFREPYPSPEQAPAAGSPPGLAVPA